MTQLSHISIITYQFLNGKFVFGRYAIVVTRLTNFPSGYFIMFKSINHHCSKISRVNWYVSCFLNKIRWEPFIFNNDIRETNMWLVHRLNIKLIFFKMNSLHPFCYSNALFKKRKPLNNQSKKLHEGLAECQIWSFQASMTRVDLKLSYKNIWPLW